MPAPGYVHPSKKKNLTAEEREVYQGLASTGASASLIREQVGPILDQREQQVIGEALNAYVSCDMTPDTAMRYWAVLSEVRALKLCLESRESSGTLAWQKLNDTSEGDDNDTDNG